MDQNNALRSQSRIHCNVLRCGSYDHALPNIRVLLQKKCTKVTDVYNSRLERSDRHWLRIWEWR